MTCTELRGTAGIGLSPVWYVALALLWLVALRLLVVGRRSPRRRALGCTMLFLSIAATFGGHDLRGAFDAATGVPDLTILIGHLSVLLSLMSIVDGAALLVGTRRYRQIAITACAVIGLIALFALIPRSLDHPDFGCWQARSPLVVAYQLLFQACLGSCLVTAGTMFLPRAREAGNRLLRVALYSLALGCAVGLAYVAVRCWWVITHGFGLPYPLEGNGFARVPLVLLDSTLILIGLGALIPAAYRVSQWCGRLVRYHRLRPLWTAMTDAAPGNVLGPVRSPLADRIDVRSVERRLYRRAVEIRDAQWELAHYVSPAMVERAHAAEATEATREALLLEIGRQAKLAGLPHDAAPDPSPLSGSADLDAESRALLVLQRLCDEQRDVAGRTLLPDQLSSQFGPER